MQCGELEGTIETVLGLRKTTDLTRQICFDCRRAAYPIP
jgi:hypothetical protein